MSVNRITIVTPSFNQAAYLEDCVRSVLSQGYSNLEYFVIDGGSTDGSIDILKRYDDRITYWVSETDRGQSHAINKGFSMATGEILGWVNSDDMLADGSLAIIAETFRRRSKIDLLIGQRLVIDKDGQAIAHENFDFHNCFYDMLAFLFYPPQECCFWRRSLHERVGCLREDLHFSMDFDWFLRLSRLGNTFQLNRQIGIFRCYEEQKGNRRNESGENLMRVREEFFRNSRLPFIYWKFIVKAYRSWCNMTGMKAKSTRTPTSRG